MPIAIQTKYYGPTNYRPSRIKAFTSNGHALWQPYTYDGAEHRKAAEALRDKMGWRGELIEGGTADGYMYVFAPKPTLAVGTQVHGSKREMYINGETYIIEPNRKRNDPETGHLQDAWCYVLPTGESFTHPSKFGALLLCLKHAGGGAWKNPTNKPLVESTIHSICV